MPGAEDSVEPGAILRQAAATGQHSSPVNPLAAQLLLNSSQGHVFLQGGSSGPWTLHTGGNQPTPEPNMDYAALMGMTSPQSGLLAKAAASLGGMAPIGANMSTPEPVCILDSLQTHLEFLRRVPPEKVLKLRGTARLRRETMFETLASHFGQFGAVATVLLTDCMLVKSTTKGLPFKTRLGNMGFIVMDEALSVTRTIMHSPHHVGDDRSCVLKVEAFNMKDNEPSQQGPPQHQQAAGGGPHLGAPPQAQTSQPDPSMAPLVKMHLDLQDKVAQLERKLTTMTMTKPEVQANGPSTQSQLMAEMLLREVQKQLGNTQQLMNPMMQKAPPGNAQQAVPPGNMAWPPGSVPAIAAWPPGMNPAGNMPQDPAMAAASLRSIQAVFEASAFAECQRLQAQAQAAELQQAQSSANKWMSVNPNMATSLRDILVELNGQNPACVFVVRGISTISSRASDAVDLLCDHFSRYGEVVKVLVPHQKIKAHFDQSAFHLQVKSRPDNRGFIVMKDPKSVKQIMDAGQSHAVSDVLGQVHRISTEPFQPSIEGPAPEAQAGGLHESPSANCGFNHFQRGCSSDSTAPPGSASEGFVRNYSLESNWQSSEFKAEAESSQRKEIAITRDGSPGKGLIIEG